MTNASRTKFLWTLERDGHAAESAISTPSELSALLNAKSLHGLLPIDWVVDVMATEESPEGHASHHHDVEAPNGWKLSWSRLGR